MNEKQKNRLPIFALILGILSVIISLLSGNFNTSLVALILSIVSIKSAPARKGMSITALIFSIIALAVAIIFTYVLETSLVEMLI